MLKKLAIGFLGIFFFITHAHAEGGKMPSPDKANEAAKKKEAEKKGEKK